MKRMSKIEISFLLGFIIVCICMFGIDYFFHVEKERTNEKIANSLNELDVLKKSENWPGLIALGESILASKRNELTEQQCFDVINQLISTYFFLGDFEKAKYHATSLLSLADELKQPERIATSLYKFSAVLRAEADQADPNVNQQQLFEEARYYAQAALQLCNTKCCNYKSLKAKILFNAAAAEADDPRGNLTKAVTMYEEALHLFRIVQEDSYYQKTVIRLAKVYLLQGEIDQSWNLIEQLKQLKLAPRTFMHLCYLQAQILQAKHLDQEALQIATQGKELAESLHAEADLRRFHVLLSEIDHVTR